MKENIAKETLFVYNLLTQDKKINFLYDFFVLNDGGCTNRYLTNILKSKFFKGVSNSDDISFIIYSIEGSKQVNMLMMDDQIHFNSDSINAMYDAISELIILGMIFISSNIKKDKNVFCKRFYKCYTMVNDKDSLIPINFN